MNPLISVIIPTYNEEKDIGDCINSLKSQTYKPFEVIVVDDGSKDKTRQILKSLKVKTLSQSHLGPGPARNLGAKHARGDILVFVDSDMTFEKDFLDKLTLPIRQKKTIGTFSTEEIVSNWKNVWARCWNFNNGNRSSRRVRDDPNDQEDFRSILASEFKRVGGFTSIGYTDSRTLINKLNVKPLPVSDAVCYHKNPSSLKEIFAQSKWIGKRKMKFGLLGKFLNLVRHFLVISMVVGISQSLKYKQVKFVIFKIVYDLGFSIGVVTNLINKRTAR